MSDWVDADPIFREMRRQDRQAGPPRCADCRHWNTQDTWHREGWGHCERTRLRDGTHHDSPAYVSADADGVLETGKDFGCVQFERKERP